MADTTDTKAVDTTAKAAPKRKTAAKKAPAKKAAAKKTTARKTTAKKAPAKRKTTAKKAPAKRKPAAKKAAPDLKTRAAATGRNALLAGLGVYGKAYDQMLEQFEALQKQVDEAQSVLNERRSQAEAMYVGLVKRGEVVEKDAMKAFDELELDALTDRKLLEEQMNKAKARFEALREKLAKAM